jgi:hypothetical protein
MLKKIHKNIFNKLAERKNRGSCGQTLLDYSMLLGIVAVILSTLGPLLQRSLQGMVKGVADQVGTQINSEQAFDETGHLAESRTRTQMDTLSTYSEEAGDGIAHEYKDKISSSTESIVNMGYQEKQ